MKDAKSLVKLYDDIAHEPWVKNDDLKGLYPNEYLRLLTAVPMTAINMIAIGVPEQLQNLFRKACDLSWNGITGGWNAVMGNIRSRTRHSLTHANH